MEDLVNRFNWKRNESKIEVEGSSKTNMQSKRTFSVEDLADRFNLRLVVNQGSRNIYNINSRYWEHVKYLGCSHLYVPSLPLTLLIYCFVFNISLQR